MASAGAAGTSGRPDVLIENAETVGDFQAIFTRSFDQTAYLNTEIEALKLELENKVSMIERLITAMGAGGGGGGRGGTQLVNDKTMGPTTFCGLKHESFKTWVKQVKAYTNVKKAGFRKSLEAAEKSKVPIDDYVITAWQWAPAAEMNTSLHDLLLLITSGDALGIVEPYPGEGYEAWRRLSERFDSLSETYTYEKMNSMMRQNQCKSIVDIPAAIGKFERDC